MAEHSLTVKRACSCVFLSRAAYYRCGIDWSERDGPVIEALNVVVAGHRFRILNVLDEGVWEALSIVIDISLPAGRLVRVMEEVRELRGLPGGAIRCDNGPEQTSQSFID